MKNIVKFLIVFLYCNFFSIHNVLSNNNGKDLNNTFVGKLPELETSAGDSRRFQLDDMNEKISFEKFLSIAKKFTDRFNDNTNALNDYDKILDYLNNFYTNSDDIENIEKKIGIQLSQCLLNNLDCVGDLDEANKMLNHCLRVVGSKFVE